MIYSFDERVAKEVGVNAAIILDKFTWWIRQNEANERNCHDGRYWTFNSTKALTSMFPFFNAKQIGRILKKLIDDGYLLTGNYNSVAFDRTLWYTLSDKGEMLMQDEEMLFPKMGNEISQKWEMRFPKNGKPIPVPTISNTIDSNMRKSAKAQKEAEYEVRFAEFWQAYPKKVGKGAALKAYGKIKPNAQLHKKMLAAIEEQKRSEQWQKENGQFIPNPSTWLNQSRWEDELPTVQPKASNTLTPGGYRRKFVN